VWLASAIVRTMFMARLGELLQDARDRAGLSQGALAEQLGCDQSLVSRVERANRAVSVEELFIWAEKLGLDQNEFMAGVVEEWHALRDGSGSIWLAEADPQ